jgi:hypothetical protein
LRRVFFLCGREEAVTICGVAAKAATTTPTVYSYYATGRRADALPALASALFGLSRKIA